MCHIAQHQAHVVFALQFSAKTSLDKINGHITSITSVHWSYQAVIEETYKVITLLGLRAFALCSVGIAAEP